jgi:ABC-2 type transport system permease protein
VNKTFFIVAKEWRHIIRDPKSLVIAVLMPLLMTLLYGYAVNLDTRNIKLAVVDTDNTALSRELAGSFFRSGYFIHSSGEPDIADPERLLRSDRAHAVLVIRPGFSDALQTASPYQMGLVVDGADANRAAAATNYSSAIVFDFLRRHAPAAAAAAAGGRVAISRRVLYNPDLESPDFFVPGLIAVILMMISALLTSVAVVREKEAGTMEQLLVAPVSPRQVIAGKVIPYVGLAFVDGLLVILFAVLHFHVPFQGSLLLLVAFGFLYIVAALSIGVLISTIVNTQLVAMLSALIATVLPSVMLSGFIFEIKIMPLPLQYLTEIVPASHFVTIIRGIMLKGAGVAILWKQAVALVLITAVLLGAAANRFKLKLG